jgi:hypothetical protein
MTNILLVSIITLLIAFGVTYSRMLHKNASMKKEAARLLVNIVVLEEYINTIEENKLQSDESVHKENFIKFLSDSRDWAFQYIEEFQAGLDEFVSSIEPEINYFKEYGDLMSMSPNYYSLKKIVDEYDKLKKLLPNQEEQQ